ncbi:MAG: hypothetical protein GHCLOJNM_01430 [bacterium]|nr:hypothetical protein [bacterium]
MVRGFAVVCALVCLILAAPVSAGFVPSEPQAVQSLLPTAQVEVILPPGADVSEARGSLTIEKLPLTDRILADGSIVKTLPVLYTFVNHWHETFMFDGFNEAVLTDARGEQHYAASVLRDGEILLSGVTGLIPHGGMATFTLYYDLSGETTEADVAAMTLDLRYLNHGHPYLLSTLIAGEPGLPERPNVVELAPPPSLPEPVVPQPVVPPVPVVKEEPRPAPAPVPAPIPQVQPMPEPPVVAVAPPPVAPPIIAQPPMETPPPAPVTPVVCNPCPPCRPCLPCINPCALLGPICKLPCCLLNVACKGVNCLTGVVTKGVCDITCASTNAVKGIVCCDCTSCLPCGGGMVAQAQ